MSRIRMTVDHIELEAVLDDNKMARAVEAVLPLTAKGQVWGDEIYFKIPISEGELPKAQAEVEVGTLAYWPPGQAFCIFYGPTPASTGDMPQAYSPVNVFGKITGDATLLRGVTSGVTVSVSLVAD